MPKAELRASYRIEPLQKRHHRDAFRCSSAALDRYLQQQARQDSEKRIAAPFVLVTASAPEVLGYYTLSASQINADEVPLNLLKKLPRYPQLPVTLLGRLAVDQQLKGKGMGEFLLMDALSRTLAASTGIAAMAVLVETKDEAAAAFYDHFGFLPLNALGSRLFLPMKTVAALLG